MTFYTPRQDELHKIKRSNMLGQNDDSIKFSGSKEYDLGNGGEIELVPETLTLKRLWAKKYPIYLKLFEKPNEDKTAGDTVGSEHTFVLPSVTEEMFLFSPTGRAKEEWYVVTDLTYCGLASPMTLPYLLFDIISATLVLLNE